MCRWFLEGQQNRFLRWQHPYYKDIQQQQMPEYNVLDLGKYGKKVLLERLIRVAWASRNSSNNWLTAYVTDVRYGELTICKAAVSRLEGLQTALLNKPAPLRFQNQVTRSCDV